MLQLSVLAAVLQCLVMYVITNGVTWQNLVTASAGAPARAGEAAGPCRQVQLVLLNILVAYVIMCHILCYFLSLAGAPARAGEASWPRCQVQQAPGATTPSGICFNMSQIVLLLPLSGAPSRAVVASWPHCQVQQMLLKILVTYVITCHNLCYFLSLAGAPARVGEAAWPRRQVQHMLL
jgi:cytochrome c5